MTTRPELVRIARTWRLTTGANRPLDTLDDVLTATGYRRRGTSPNPATDDPRTANMALGQLVRAARTDQLAGRVVLQRILPGLHAAARRWKHGCRPAGIESGAAFDALVATAWDVIATYDVERRPRNIASRLVWSTIDRTLVAPARRRSASEQPRDPEVFVTTASGSDRSPSDELAELLAAATLHRDADADAIGLLCDLVRADGSTAAVAALHGVSPRTIRNRRDDATSHIRRLTQPVPC